MYGLENLEQITVIVVWLFKKQLFSKCILLSYTDPILIFDIGSSG